MSNIRQNSHCVTPNNLGGSLDTLAQLDHNTPNRAIQTLQKRAVSKYFTNEILYPLIDLKNTRQQSYWNTYHCVKTLHQTPDGKCIAKYCKNRWCIVCNRIRTGILINSYLPVIQKWAEPRFVTLTLPTVDFENLPERITKLGKDFSVLSRRIQRQFGSGEMMRKFEITWNYKTKQYHPHYHVLQDGVRNSEALVEGWLHDHPEANVLAQDNRKADKNTVIEMFKYMTKMWKRIDNEDTLKEVRVLPYPPEIMDNIFSVMHRKRTIQTYGGLKKHSEDFNPDIATVFLSEEREGITFWDWEQELRTWVDYTTGELRT